MTAGWLGGGWPVLPPAAAEQAVPDSNSTPLPAKSSIGRGDAARPTSAGHADKRDHRAAAAAGMAAGRSRVPRRGQLDVGYLPAAAGAGDGHRELRGAPADAARGVIFWLMVTMNVMLPEPNARSELIACGSRRDLLRSEPLARRRRGWRSARHDLPPS